MVKTGVFVSNNTEGYALKGCGFVGMLNGGGIWKAVPLGLTWSIWKEWNNRAFEGFERSLMDLKLLISCALFDWMAVLS